HAPNGYGKTTLLKLMSDIIGCKVFEMGRIPFENFAITFDQDITLEVIKQKDTPKEEEAVLKYRLTHKGQIKEYKLPQKAEFGSSMEVGQTLYAIEKNLPFLKRVTQIAWYDTRRDHKLNYDEIMTEYGDQLFVDKELREQLQEIQSKMPIHFIHANRLTVSKNLSPLVLIYAQELAQRITDVLAKSAALAQKLDHSFPGRLIEAVKSQRGDESLDIDSVDEALRNLDKKRLKLQKIGLIAASLTENRGDLTDLDRQTIKMLDLYIKDSKEKLEVFDVIEAKIDLMREIINKRFNYKTMQISGEKGFAFELPNKSLLMADKLSSGEQNELILIFELLFKSEPNALILIDEPEISLHIAWQQQFLEDMEAISNLTNVKIMIATHSPDIINGRWDLTTGLEEC
ncbi:MAG: putative excinuclease ATPase subunit, partial [Clostridia bacterium]|nr:putative excinuclease ATPase subunit [Clostridia bacterium]